MYGEMQQSDLIRAQGDLAAIPWQSNCSMGCIPDGFPDGPVGGLAHTHIDSSLLAGQPNQFAGFTYSDPGSVPLKS